MPDPSNFSDRNAGEPLRLHIGGREARAGWKILNIQHGPGVDYAGDCADLSRFATGSVHEIYASHVYEHLSYQDELVRALSEAHRVLVPGGVLRISVPDLDVLCRLFVDESLDAGVRYMAMRMMFGGQLEPHDFHKVGLNQGILAAYLLKAGFRRILRVGQFGLFADDSMTSLAGRLVSLNVEAFKDS